MSDELFAAPDELFAAADGLQTGYVGVESNPGLQPISLPNAAAAESVNTATALASGLIESFAPQLELLTRSIRLGVLDVVNADYVPLVDEGAHDDD